MHNELNGDIRKSKVQQETFEALLVNVIKSIFEIPFKGNIAIFLLCYVVNNFSQNNSIVGGPLLGTKLLW